MMHDKNTERVRGSRLLTCGSRYQPVTCHAEWSFAHGLGQRRMRSSKRVLGLSKAEQRSRL